MERWLDLYYQVRHAQEKADAAARAAAMYGILPDKDRFVEASLKASAERITKRLREEIKIPENGGPMKAASQECRTLPARQDAPTEKDEAASQGTAVPSQAAAEAAETRATARVAPTDNPGGSAEGREALLQPSPQAAALAAPPEETRETPVKRQGGKGKPRPSAIGNTSSHDAAVFKRQVRDRLEAARKRASARRSSSGPRARGR